MSAPRYQSTGPVHAERSPGGQRAYATQALRRVPFIRIAQTVGLSLDEIRLAMASLPESRTPSKADWARLSASWRPRLDDRSCRRRLRDHLHSCIGCGCRSLRACWIYNPDDAASSLGADRAPPQRPPAGGTGLTLTRGARSAPPSPVGEDQDLAEYIATQTFPVSAS